MNQRERGSPNKNERKKKERNKQRKKERKRDEREGIETVRPKKSKEKEESGEEVYPKALGSTGCC